MKQINSLFFNNANSRETYFTIHNVKKAHIYGKGRGVRVGIIDWLFGKEKYPSLYDGFIDLTNSDAEFYNYEGHGLWMATVLKEVAPECKIFAIHGCRYESNKTDTENDKNRIDFFEKSIQWAIENDIEILTYSHAKFPKEFLERANEIINKAAQKGIITTFIHCDNINNLWPYGCFPFQNNKTFNREPDFNIYHFDYNQLYLPQYERYLETISKGEKIESGNDLPYFSMSSMSPVLGGFISILKSINSNITLDDIRHLLNYSVYESKNIGSNWYDINQCSKIVDIGKAAEQLFKLYNI